MGDRTGFREVFRQGKPRSADEYTGKEDSGQAYTKTHPQLSYQWYHGRRRKKPPHRRYATGQSAKPVIIQHCFRPVSYTHLDVYKRQAMGSSFELETQVILAFRFKYINEEQMTAFEEMVRLVQKMSFGLYNSLENKSG